MLDKTPLSRFLNRHAGEQAVIVGRGPTWFDFSQLGDFQGPVLFINDAVQLEKHVSGHSYFFAMDRPMIVWLERGIRSTPVLPRDLQPCIEDARSQSSRPLSIVFYEYNHLAQENLLRMIRQDLAASGSLFNGGVTILSALHFAWLCGCASITFIGCDGINDAPGLRRLGDPVNGYDRRLENLSNTSPGWHYARIREEQDRVCRILGLEVRYEGTPSVPHPNRFHREEFVIPAIAHFVWLGGAMPEFMASNIERFRQLHPAWRINVCTALPAELPSDLRRACLQTPQLCMRSDILRIWLLHEQGGIYLDGDVYPVRAFDELRHYEHFFASEIDPFHATNCVVGATQGCDFIENLFRRTRAICEQPVPLLRRTAFGPTLYTEFIHCYPGLVNTLPAHYFCMIRDHEIAFGLARRSFHEIHRELVARESQMTDGVWPYGIHTYGIPGSQIHFGVQLTSWSSASGRADALLRRLPPGTAAGVEVGVADGKMSAYLLGHHPALLLIMVDRWTPPPDESSYARAVDEKAWWSSERHNTARQNALAATEFASSRRRLIQAESLEAALQVDDRSLDFAFIDADHSYATVAADIATWQRKLKPSGWLCGHDYYGIEGIAWGVKRAVDEFISSSGRTLELDENDTWFVRID